MKKLVLLILTASLLFGCMPNKSTVSVNFNKVKNAQTSSIPSATVSSVQIINNQLVITGNGFNDVTNVKVGGSAFNEVFTIESKTATKIIANSIRAFSFDVSKLFNLIISDASASATFPIDFSLCQSTLNGKGFNCSAPVADKDVLAYDAVSGTWKPRPASGLNYLGTFDASSNPGAGPAIQPAGAYYVISDDGMIAAVSFAVGDWLVSNGSVWQKIDNSSAVLSVHGRNGAIVAQQGDYTLDLLGDVSFPVAPVAGKILKFDGTNWIAGDDLAGGGAGSVTTTTILDGAVTDSKITSLATSKLTGTISSAQIADGTIVNADVNAAAAIDYSKINVPDGAIPYAKLNIANGDIPAAKISGLPSATVVLATTITDGDTTHAPDGNVVFDTLATKLDKTGGTISTILNVPTPVLNTEATTKLYVDTADNLKASKAGDTFSGVLTLDNDLRVKGGANYVTVKGNAASAAYTLTLPANAGTANQVLTTNGSGALSWSATSSVVSSLNAANISGGTVSNAEFDWLDGVTSSIQAQLNAKEASLPGGGTALQYFAGNKTLQTLNTAAVPELTNLYFTQARAIASPLTGVTSTAGTITAVDTILGAFGKMINTQGDYVSKSANSTVLSELTVSGTGTIVVPTPTLLTHAANMGYVQSYVDTYGQWTKNGTDVYRASGKVGIGTNSPLTNLHIVSNQPASEVHPNRAGFILESEGTSIGGRLALKVYSDTESPLFVGYHARGTKASPTALLLGDQIGGFAAVGYDGAGGWQTGAHIRYNTTENWSPTNIGSSISFRTPANGSTSVIERMKIDHSGNVGIGVTSPVTKFEVNESTALSSVLGTVRDITTTYGNAGSSNSRLIVRQMRTESGGASHESSRFMIQRKVDSTDQGFIAFNGGGTDAGGTANRGVSLGVGTVDYLTMLNNGYVGFGTPTPQTLMHVYSGSSAFQEFRMDAARNNAGAYGISFVKSRGTTGARTAALLNDSLGDLNWSPYVDSDTIIGASARIRAIASENATLTGNGGLLQFSTTPNGSLLPQERMRITQDGNVGIGTITPSAKLEVNGKILQGPNVTWGEKTTIGIDAPLVGVTSATIGSTDGNLHLEAKDGKDVYLNHYNVGNGDTLMNTGLNNTGNVGIGLTAPDQKLVVYNGTTTGKYTTGGWTHSSDRRLKHDISPIEDALDKILKIRGVEYIFNADAENKTQLGFIAQEVEPIFPEVVQTDKKGFKSMIYSNLIAPLVESVKALYGRLVGVEKHNQAQDRQIASKADKTETAALRAENEKLKKENSDIKAYLCSKDPKAIICK